MQVAKNDTEVGQPKWADFCKTCQNKNGNVFSYEVQQTRKTNNPKKNFTLHVLCLTNKQKFLETNDFGELRNLNTRCEIHASFRRSLETRRSNIRSNCNFRHRLITSSRNLPKIWNHLENLEVVNNLH